MAKTQARATEMSQIVEEVAVNLKTNMDTLPAVSTECCIYRVPEKLRRTNAEAYTPQVISIGPFHRDKTAIQMTAIKLRYLIGFLRHCKADLPACIGMISETEDCIRQCYQEKLTQSSRELVEMIFVDAVFVVELFIRNHYLEHRDEDDEIFSKQWMSNAIFHDLLLLENQVPFFVLENLYDLTTLSTTVTFFKLSYEYFKDVLHGHELASTGVRVKHLVDYVRAQQLPAFQRRMTSKQDKKCQLTRSAMELQEAGVEFRRGKPGEGTFFLPDVNFKTGTLVMRHVVVHQWTEVWFMNMIAYEQCHHLEKNITSYAILMDSLIDTPADIDILISCGILENRLGSKEDVASLFNSLYKETMRDSSEFLYSSLCQNLNECHPPPRVLVKEVAVNLKTNMDTLPDVSIGCCIYRVPEKLRRANAEAYTPQVISIGPFHRDKTAIQLMAIKLRYLTDFLRHSKADLPACIRIISELEDRIRQCYQENLTQASKELVEMILVDAVFVVE